MKVLQFTIPVTHDKSANKDNDIADRKSLSAISLSLFAQA
jgi:hypothetical protein